MRWTVLPRPASKRRATGVVIVDVLRTVRSRFGDAPVDRLGAILTTLPVSRGNERGPAPWWDGPSR